MNPGTILKLPDHEDKYVLVLCKSVKEELPYTAILVMQETSHWTQLANGKDFCDIILDVNDKSYYPLQYVDLVPSRELANLAAVGLVPEATAASIFTHPSVFNMMAMRLEQLMELHGYAK